MATSTLPPRSAAALVGLVCSGVVVSCAVDPDGPRTESPSPEVPAGVEVVHHDGPSYPDVALLPLVEGLRLGVSDGPEHLRFFRIVEIALDRQDRVIVADGGSGQIRVFTPDGTHVVSFGRRGEGPGEFRRISALFLQGDTLVAVDPSQSRTTRFRLDGELIDAWPMAEVGDFRIPLGFGDGGFVLDTSARGSGWRYEIGVARQDTTRISFAPGGLDPNAPLSPIVHLSRGRRFGIDAGVTMTANSPLWEPEPAHAIDGRGRVHVHAGHSYAIDIFAPDGSRQRRITREHSAAVVTDALVDRFERESTTYWDTTSQRGGEWQISMAAAVGRVALPGAGYLPALGRMLVSSGGAVWVERPDLVADPLLLEWARAGSQPSYWDVFLATGDFRGTVELPPSMTPMAATDDALLGVLRDDLGVEHVVRWVLAAPGHSAAPER